MPYCPKIIETSVVLIVFNGVICDVTAYTVVVSVTLHESGAINVLLGPLPNNTEVDLTIFISTQNHTIAG